MDNSTILFNFGRYYNIEHSHRFNGNDFLRLCSLIKNFQTLPDFGISSSLKYGRFVAWQAAKIKRFLKYVRNLIEIFSLRWNEAFFFRRGWVPNLLWVAYRILFPEIVFHLNSEFSGKMISTWRVGGIRKIQDESWNFERKKDLNLNGFISLQHFFPKTSLFLWRINCGRFVEATTFVEQTLFLSENHHQQNLEAEKLSVVAGCLV